MTVLEKRVLELEKAIKESLKREVTLARKLVALEKTVHAIDIALRALRSQISQVQQKSRT